MSFGGLADTLRSDVNLEAELSPQGGVVAQAAQARLVSNRSEYERAAPAKPAKPAEPAEPPDHHGREAALEAPSAQLQPGIGAVSDYPPMRWLASSLAELGKTLEGPTPQLSLFWFLFGALSILVMLLAGILNIVNFFKSPSSSEDVAFTITLKRVEGARKLGVEMEDRDGSVLVTSVASDGLIGHWNFVHPERQVRVGDTIVEANGTSGDFDAVVTRCARDINLELRIQRGDSEVLPKRDKSRRVTFAPEKVTHSFVNHLPSDGMSRMSSIGSDVDGEGARQADSESEEEISEDVAHAADFHSQIDAYLQRDAVPAQPEVAEQPRPAA